MYKITFSKVADKTLRKMPGNFAIIITKKIKQLAVNPKKMHNVKKLTDHPGYRLRIGDWRVLYTLNETEMIIHIVSIKTRGEVYK
ncbi:MAG: type II toxin-antitoxin system RelE/ParE family toxin [Candidatus Latescibacteria bacterium]|nr:type II toxin-antitoxin system RelE/ParE family toxin [Candidatus Latescibacterota bacterium]